MEKIEILHLPKFALNYKFVIVKYINKQFEFQCCCNTKEDAFEELNSTTNGILIPISSINTSIVEKAPEKPIYSYTISDK